ncbi:hypothetical protein NL676_023126 [Syzygium grande]|nr:hypothetical protein NL676_023126 [Syzygium grande]
MNTRSHSACFAFLRKRFNTITAASAIIAMENWWMVLQNRNFPWLQIHRFHYACLIKAQSVAYVLGNS